jgi:hypothetical protein
MDDQNIKKVLSLFSTMEDCEKAMSEYYLACSVLTADHYEFCVGLSEEEKDHVTIIKMIKQIFIKSPASFKASGRFDTATLEDFCSRVKRETGKIESGSVTLKQALQASAELEGTLIETNYFEIITSENRKYLELAEKITSANNRHRESLLSKITDISQQKD